MKCAAGHIIPDEDYRPEMEGRAWMEVGPSLGTTNNMDLICRCQYAHDGGVYPVTMKEDLCKIAEDFDLTIPNASRRSQHENH